MKKFALLIMLLFIAVLPSSAHVIQYELDKMSTNTVFWRYTLIGIQHIMDHTHFMGRYANNL